MAKVSPIQTQFNAGELSPLLYGRVDFAKYANGLKTCLNYVPLIQGPVTRRPGTYYVTDVKDSSKKTRLVAFQFSTTQAYIIEFGDQYLRFYKDHGQIQSGGSPYEISTPYTEADLGGLKFAQSADVLYIAHPDYAPRKLSRTGHTSWTLTEITFDWVPFLEQNGDESITVTASAATGTGITLTASAGSNLFNTNHVGAYWRLSELVASKHDKWETGKSISSGDIRRYNGNVYEAASSATTGNNPPVHEYGTESDGGVDWTYLHSGEGYVKITAFTDSEHVTANVIKRLPTSATSGTFRWSEGAWSDDNGYPAVVTFFQDRLCWAATAGRPQSIWMSKTGDYENHRKTESGGTVTDDSAVFITLNTDQVNVIRWMTNDEKGLLVGTVGAEWTVTPYAPDQPLSPSNIDAKRGSTRGSADISATRVGKSVLFVQRAGRKLREMAYVFESDGFRSPDMTVLAEHITQQGTITEMAYQQEPYSVLWAVRSDGALLGFTFDREQDVVAWHRHEVGGVSDANGTKAKVESIASIPAPSGNRDEVWLIVQRYVDGATVRHIEYMTKFWEQGDAQNDAFFLDCGLTYDGAATTTLSGLDHLEGETVSILADGAAHPDKTVASGGVTLDRSASKVHVGYGYNSDGEMLRLEAGARDGTAQGKTKRIHRVTMRLHETLGLKTGRTLDDLDEVLFRHFGDDMGAAVPLFSGDMEVPYGPGYDNEAYMCWRQSQPFPGTIVAVMPQLLTQDR